MAGSFTVGALAIAAREANAVGAVRLTLLPRRLEVELLCAGTFRDGYVPGGLTRFVRFAVPYSAVRGLIRRDRGVLLSLDPSVATPYSRFLLTHFTDLPLELLAVVHRRRAMMKVLAYLAPIPVALFLTLRVPESLVSGMLGRASLGVVVTVALATMLSAVSGWIETGGPLSRTLRDQLEKRLAQRMGFEPASFHETDIDELEEEPIGAMVALRAGPAIPAPLVHAPPPPPLPPPPPMQRAPMGRAPAAVPPPVQGGAAFPPPVGPPFPPRVAPTIVEQTIAPPTPPPGHALSPTQSPDVMRLVATPRPPAVVAPPPPTVRAPAPPVAPPPVAPPPVAPPPVAEPDARVSRTRWLTVAVAVLGVVVALGGYRVVTTMKAPRSAPATVTETSAPADEAPPAVVAADPPPASIAEQAPAAPPVDACTCARSDSPLWRSGLPALTMIPIPTNGQPTIAPVKDEEGISRYGFDVAVVNNAAISLKDVRIVITFARRNAKNERVGATDRGLFWEGALGPTRSVKWSVKGPGTELKIEMEEHRTLAETGVGPADGFAKLLTARFSQVRLHGAMMLAYLGDPRALGAAQSLSGFSEIDAATHARVLRAASPIRVCEVKAAADRIEACVHNLTSSPLEGASLAEAGGDAAAKRVPIAETVPAGSGVRVVSGGLGYEPEELEVVTASP